MCRHILAAPLPLLPMTLVGVLTVVIITPPPGAGGDMFTSTQKIVDMAAMEATLLDSLSEYIDSEHDTLRKLSQFLWKRFGKFHEVSKEASLKLAEHPNGAYLTLQVFTQHWVPLLQARPGLRDALGTEALSLLPTEEDYNGALSSLIRLQHVYNLSASSMYAGNYLGHEGPALSLSDAFLLGRQAFTDGYLPESITWLELCTRLLQEQGGLFPSTFSVSGTEASPFVTLAWSTALLGRAYVYINEKEKAQEMYNVSFGLDPNVGDGLQLKEELKGHLNAYSMNSKVWDHNMTTLCLRPKHQHVTKILPLHVCRYKRAFGNSYLIYKEEILSVQPYASLFYDVIHDTEIDVIKGHIKGKMFRGLVGQGSTATIAPVRTSDLGWIHDTELNQAATLSQRVKVITGLEVDQRHPRGPSSAEAMQVVNYGLGGHYDAHVDPHINAPSNDVLLSRSGPRIATFLMYLSDVEVGGSTVFLRAGISVSPRKGMALFWYNFAPDMENIDNLTQHAACPVLVGQKWVANKWLLTYGNTFHRPCGPHANSTQLHVEEQLTGHRPL
ncbi:prolyl 4-hydroxylase subunit alpha-3-like [Babylonia areolata]|uniref:prolyl 4-hydroxylase subunit alpha-3-like n=1 Tax=Babylonia areolata TaxID=304850 RepID=UPI003FD61115